MAVVASSTRIRIVDASSLDAELLVDETVQLAHDEAVARLHVTAHQQGGRCTSVQVQPSVTVLPAAGDENRMVVTVVMIATGDVAPVGTPARLHAIVHTG